MRWCRFPAPAALALLLIVALSASLSAQNAKRSTATDINTHKFQAQGMAVPGNVAPADATTISPSALQQMNALLLDKKQRTPAQAKISSRVIYTTRMMLGLPAAIGVPYLQTGLELDDHNNLYLDITARVTDGLLRQLRAMGVRIIRSNPRYNTIRAFVPPEQVEAIAGLSDVIFIQPRQQAMTQQGTPRPVAGSGPAVVQQRSPGFAQRAALIRQKLSHALANQNLRRAVTNGTGQGSQTSEGDATHRAADARGTFGVSGVGVNIGVLSDGVSNLAASQALGDLPPTCPAGPPCVTVLPGQTGGGDEGTAMLEIVHDLAPSANLFFATAFSGITSFADNIRALRTAGCDIIVDDVFYFVETPFQDGQLVPSPTNGGVVIQAVNDVTADGALYFSSAGNQGNLDDNFSGNYEGDFVDGGTNPLLTGGTVTLFGGGNPYDTVNFNAGEPIFLFWADPLGGSANDYDLYVLNSAGTAILDASTDIQDGNDDPVEAVNPTSAGNRLVVFKVTGAADVFFHLDTLGGGLDVATAGQVHGHAAAAAAFAVAATPAFQAIAPGYPSGPYPNPFNSTNVVEPYSSDGPRQVFFEADGTAITPGNFTSTGGLIRQKPEVTAADGVSVTGVGGFPSPFYGTSAAAPHAAAIAGLVKSAKAGLTNAEINTALTSTAIDIEGAGIDRDSGSGIVMAFEAIQSLGISGGANPELSAITAAENPGNSDGGIEAGEGASLVIELKNTNGTADATNISTQLTTTTPGVFITQPATSAYPDLAAGTGVATNLSPFTFTVASDAPCGVSADFTLTVTYTGGTSPRMLTFSVPTGPPPVSVTTTLDTTAPTPVPGITTSTGTQTGRMFRDGVASACGAPKTFPGVFDAAGARQFDAYSFNACRDACTEVTVTNLDVGNPFSLFSAAYSPSYNPADFSANYAADAGVSGATTSYGIDTLAGTPYTIVVHETDAGGGVGTNYTVAISACSVNCTTPNQLPVVAVHNVTVGAGPGGVADASIDNGSFDPEDGPLTLTQTPLGPYPTGTTNVMLTVVDDKGATAQDSADVTVQDFAVTATLADMTLDRGQSATRTLTVSPGASFDFAVTFACSGQPSDVSCSFAPPSVTPGAAPVDVVMTVTRSGSSASLVQKNLSFYATWLSFGGFGLIGMVGIGTRKRSRKALMFLALLLVIPTLLLMAGCAGNNAPQPRTATVTVSATAGATVHTSTFHLTLP